MEDISVLNLIQVICRLSTGKYTIRAVRNGKSGKDGTGAAGSLTGKVNQLIEGESKMNNNGNSNNGDNQSCSSQQKTNEQQDKGILDKTYEEITATIGSARSSDNITIPKSLVVKGILVALGIHFFF